jgi:hypothetical protein
MMTLLPFPFFKKKSTLKGFQKNSSGILETFFDRSNDAPEIGVFWVFLTTCQKQKTPQIQYLQGFERFEGF